MNVISPESIKQCEEELIETIKDDINFDKLTEILKSRLHSAKFICTDGDIVVHENKVAYKLNLSVNIRSEIILDREGNLVSSSDPVNLNDLNTDPDATVFSSDEDGDTSESSEMDISEMVPAEGDTLPTETPGDVTDVLQSNRDFWSGKSES